MRLRQAKADLWIGCGLLVLCGFAGWRTTFIKPGFNPGVTGPDFLPWLVIGLIGLLSFALIVRALRAGGDATDETVMPGKRTLLAMGAFALLMVGYAAAFMPIGYLPSTLATFVIGLLLLGERNWLLVVLFPVGMTFAIYYSFTKLLSVWLP
ncbi:tripartite tricarboxylate transporter TctB family protein [Notoacmeibacter ruber]|uniref:Tripartite tricarboxylate transporter TctB family protein n=1 Tax=Notoacmeibacter ruber TaxID=2670375 RepID=A0A3L7JGW9_9HYPH|nr:tripartite tricarboxylate transporter TctB family protein [Notoacmeibacter ruber]RLQ88871.1 tripartite tricarboxylate transporter TctB family protein [Notoacmeibacter ruber]